MLLINSVFLQDIVAWHHSVSLLRMFAMRHICCTTYTLFIIFRISLDMTSELSLVEH